MPVLNWILNLIYWISDWDWIDWIARIACGKWRNGSQINLINQPNKFINWINWLKTFSHLMKLIWIWFWFHWLINLLAAHSGILKPFIQLNQPEISNKLTSIPFIAVNEWIAVRLMNSRLINQNWCSGNQQINQM